MYMYKRNVYISTKLSCCLIYSITSESPDDVGSRLKRQLDRALWDEFLQTHAEREQATYRAGT